MRYSSQYYAVISFRSIDYTLYSDRDHVLSSNLVFTELDAYFRCSPFILDSLVRHYGRIAPHELPAANASAAARCIVTANLSRHQVSVSRGRVVASFSCYTECGVFLCSIMLNAQHAFYSCELIAALNVHLVDAPHALSQLLLQLVNQLSCTPLPAAMAWKLAQRHARFAIWYRCMVVCSCGCRRGCRRGNGRAQSTLPPARARAALREARTGRSVCSSRRLAELIPIFA